MAGEMNVTATAGTIQNGYGKRVSSASADQTLGQDAFLQILVAQMKYQDPLQPMQDREFISQMALFSTVEQLTRLNQTVAELKEMISGAEAAGKPPETGGSEESSALR